MTDDVLPIIERIYRAAAEPAALGLLAAELAREFDAESTFLYTVEKSRERGLTLNKNLLSATANFDHWAHASYTNYYLEQDGWSRRLVAQPFPAVIIDQELMTHAEFSRSEIWTDYYRKIGIFHAIGSFFPVDANDAGAVAVHRPRSAEGFGPDERRLLQRLMPHLQRVFQIHQRIDAVEQGRALTTEVLEKLSLGAILVDGNARIVFANGLARRLLQSGRGLTVARGCLRAQLPDQHAILARLIGEAALTGIGRAGGAGGHVAVSRASQAPLSVLVSPFRKLAGERPEQQAALVLISDPDTRVVIPEQALARSFGLTLAEARLLAALVDGRTLSDYAQGARVTMNTAKTQLRQIFLKTGYNRQADIIRAVLADPLLKIRNAARTV